MKHGLAAAAEGSNQEITTRRNLPAQNVIVNASFFNRWIYITNCHCCYNVAILPFERNNGGQLAMFFSPSFVLSDGG